MSNSLVVTALARCFLAGSPVVDDMVDLAAQTLGVRWRWLPALARHCVQNFPPDARPRERDVTQFLLQDQTLSQELSRKSPRLRVAHWVPLPRVTRPVDAAAAWDLPPLPTIVALAAWLRVQVSELEWLSDPCCIAEEANFRLGHYHYQATLKRSGAIRLIEAPKARIKTPQRKILNSTLDRIPAYPAVHGFVRGRSIQTFVLPHVGRPVVLRMDVRDFFPSFTVARARAFFRTAGYGESVAHSLGGLCTHSVPRALWNHLPLDVAPVQLRENAGMYEIRHLPQGAPTSPALANICS